MSNDVVLDPFAPSAPTTAGDKRRWTQLPGAALALSIAAAARHHAGLTLVITADSATAARLEAELDFFLGEEATSELPVLTLPDWETLPYDYFSPHQDIISERLSTLYRLPRLQRGILVVPTTTLLHHLSPPEYLQQNSLVVEKGQTFSLKEMSTTLQNAGYHCVDTVYEHGEFAVRGSLIDIFPMGSEVPFRIDLFDDEVESLRTFEPDTQRTLDQIDAIRLLPAKEYPLDKGGIAHFREYWHQRFNVDHRACPLYQDVSAGFAPAGIEYYLPLFFEHCGVLFDYLPPATLVFTVGSVADAAARFWTEAEVRYQSRRVDPERPILAPAELFINAEQLFARLKHYPRIEVQEQTEAAAKAQTFGAAVLPDLGVQIHSANPLIALQSFLLETSERVLFCAESPGRRETVGELLGRIGVNAAVVDNWQAFLNGDQRIGIVVSPLSQGVQLFDAGIVVITESELFGHQVQQRRRRKTSQDGGDQIIKNLTELHLGAPVVHIEHGVGRYRGLETLEVDGQAHEFLVLEYAGSDKLYVPVANLDQISRYAGAQGTGAEEEGAPLHKLGSDLWQKQKRKAAEQIRDVAAELLEVYAKRAAQPGFAFNDPSSGEMALQYANFCGSFPFELTPDQETTIEAVIADMRAPKPMDRLVCGDVGFGKTEVAMRAAFIAVQSGKQVAILVPTTLLAQQHFDNFKDRFADWPVNIEVLSRFRSAKEIDEVQKRIAGGKVDIVIGTHKLLQDNIRYHELGLLIVDEEHRFGVRQKDKLKSLRTDVDILTLTATPIPRTLNMSMSGIRDLSIISTPPEKRLSVKTFVHEYEAGLAREAISREILRGGQVYYLHNEVKTIDTTAAKLRELVPEARIGVAHGQLRERELERIMSDFYHKRFNVLVCSTIIETGIDVPNANTIIIDRADKLGLAQLHQLRGRVGRSHHQAYAYLLTPPQKQMTADAVKRLEAIASTVDLGAGFTLATHDMEIRGAGELLGDEQSGQIQNIGFSLYMELLDRAVKALRKGLSLEADFGVDDKVEVNLRLPALIPDTYLADVHARLIMYKRVSSATDDDALQELQVEMIDRFGLLPAPVKNLFRVSAIKLKAAALGITKLEASNQHGRLEFGKEPAVDPLVIVKLVQTQPQNYQLSGGNRLKFHADMENSESRFSTVETLLEHLAVKDKAA